MHVLDSTFAAETSRRLMSNQLRVYRNKEDQQQEEEHGSLLRSTCNLSSLVPGPLPLVIKLIPLLVMLFLLSIAENTILGPL